MAPQANITPMSKLYQQQKKQYKKLRTQGNHSYVSQSIPTSTGISSIRADKHVPIFSHSKKSSISIVSVSGPKKVKSKRHSLKPSPGSKLKKSQASKSKIHDVKPSQVPQSVRPSYETPFEGAAKEQRVEKIFEEAKKELND